MDRQAFTTGQLIPNGQLLGMEKGKLVSLGYALEAIMGAGGTVVSGLACAPTPTPSLSVVVGRGSIMTTTAIDGVAYSDLGADTNATIKQGILQEPGATLTLTAPSTPGYSQVYLIQAKQADVDTSTTVPFYNAANPAQPYNGPNNSGNATLTLRQSQCVVSLKAGAAAATGSQAAPSPDVGNVGLYTITLVNGQTQITSGQIVQLPTAPFVPVTLPGVPAAAQSGAWVTATVSGTNALTATLQPAPATVAPGFEFHFLPSNTNTGAVTISIPNVGTWPVVVGPNTALIGGELIKNRWSRVIFDGARFQVGNSAPGIGTGRTRAPANIDLYVSSSGSDTAGDGLTLATAWATPQKAWDTLQRNYDITGVTATIHCSGALTSGVVAQGPVVGSQSPGSVIFQGAGSGTTSITATNASCFSAQSGAIFTVSGFTLSATGTASGQGAALYTTPGGILVFGSGIVFGACDVAHTFAQGGQISSSGDPYTISGTAQAHLDAQLGGIITVSAAVTLVGTPTFTLAFAVAAFYGLVYVGGSSYSGGAIGSRYSTSSGAIIVNGAGTNFLPGSLGGIANSPGFYM